MTVPPRIPSLSLTLHTARHGTIPVLGDLQLTVMAGETVAVTGPSGIGKTTLLRVLAGLHRAWSGTLDVSGRVAMVFQEPVLMPWRSALDNLTIATGCTQAAAEQVLAEVGLVGLGARYPAALSLGQQRRLALARAFAARPAVLLLDEAFVSLDPALAAEMRALFQRLRDAAPLATVMVTHDLAEAMALADRIVRLDGRPATIQPVPGEPVASQPPIQNIGPYLQLSASGVTSSRSYSAR